ncbi:leucine-rich repeat protein [Mycoplasma sp. NEAQ87857]|uniref:leucine-rich repeat domain-containing protein n=1 Tax=Mycoplasma sp. NEAQ87857 TaxID=2683967 RepID=UPI0013161A76|nr:leucine-rich repeat domain-containing protein [Mycoplasma sp. NEAQ87857]QGZ97673.1 leucine-rich repeat protein [Mycoplasma sp. NEAQ87857]
MKKFKSLFLTLAAFVPMAGIATMVSCNKETGYFKIKGNELVGLTEAGSKQTDLVLPESVTIIGPNAFKNQKLKSITGANVVEIKDNAFNSTLALEAATFNKVTKIGDQAFYGSRIQTVNFEALNDIKNIGNRAFMNTSYLKTFNSAIDQETLKSQGTSIFQDSLFIK